MQPSASSLRIRESRTGTIYEVEHHKGNLLLTDERRIRISSLRVDGDRLISSRMVLKFGAMQPSVE